MHMEDWAMAEGLLPRAEERALLHQFARFLLDHFPEAEMIPQKSQIAFHLGGPFCAVTPPERWGKHAGLGLSLFLDEPLESPRMLHVVQPYPRRYTHHMLLLGPQALDEELLGWLERAVAFRRRIKRRKG